MEFFEFVGVGQAFWGFIALESRMQSVWISLAVAFAVYLAMLILGGIGLSAMAKKQGITNAWLAFIPFANTYFAGQIAGEITFFGKKIKNCGLFAMIAEIVFVALSTFSLVLYIQLLPSYRVEVNDVGQLIGYGFKTDLIPLEHRWMIPVANIVTTVANLFNFVQFALLLFMFTGIYRKYYPRSPMLMTLLSVFLPVRGIVLFALRGNEPVDYNDYIRQKMGSYRQSGGFGGFPQGGYGQGGAPSEPHEDPFGGEFGQEDKRGGVPEDPFEEFAQTPKEDN